MLIFITNTNFALSKNIINFNFTLMFGLNSWRFINVCQKTMNNPRSKGYKDHSRTIKKLKKMVFGKLWWIEKKV